MIEIVTLFLGLYSGPQTVEVRVEDPVVAVELRLDGETVATRSQPPWLLRFDLGGELVPHRLEAVGYDPSGVEVGRSRRWIHRGAVPDGDDEVLTAVAVTLDGGLELPAPAQMDGWFLGSNGEPLEVVRVERGRALVVIVRDAATQPALDHIAYLHAAAVEVSARWQLRQDRFLRLEDEVSFRFLSPRAPPVSRLLRSQEIFNSTPIAPAGDNGLLWHATRVRPLRFQQRISDAVAIAGLEAHASRGRRLVFLLTDRMTRSSSRYRQEEVRRLLADLQVPLKVWTFESEQPPAESAAEPDGESWSPTLRIRPPELDQFEVIDAFLRQLERAYSERIGRELDRQRVVWLRGEHLPHSVSVSDAAAGIRLSGEEEWSNS